MKELINDYLNYLVTSEKRDLKKTADKYKMCLNEFINFMNIQSIEDIKKLTYIDIRQNYLCKLRDDDGLGNQSLNLWVVSIKGFFKYLKGRKLINDNVAVDIKRFTVQTKQEICKEDELHKLLNIAKEEFEHKKDYLSCRNNFILNMLLATGLRNSELRSIKMTDISWKDGSFHVNGKYSKERYIKLCEPILKMYREYLEYRNLINTEDEHLFVSNNGKGLDVNTIGNIFKKFLKMAKIDTNITPHGLRHVFGSTLISSGVPIEVVAKMMGHSNINILYAFYLHVEEDCVDEAFEKNKFYNRSENEKNIRVIKWKW